MSFNLYTGVKWLTHRYITVLGYAKLTAYLPLLMCCIFSYVFMLLISILLFQLDEISAFFCKVGLIVINSLSFCLEKLLYHLHFWRTICWVFLVGRFLFSALWIHHATFSWPAWFLPRNTLISLWGFLCKWQVYFLLLLRFFVFDFLSFLIMSWRRSLWVEIIWGPVWIWMSKSLPSLLHSINFHPLFPSFPPGTPIMYRLNFLNGVL